MVCTVARMYMYRMGMLLVPVVQVVRRSLASQIMVAHVNLDYRSSWPDLNKAQTWIGRTWTCPSVIHIHAHIHPPHTHILVASRGVGSLVRWWAVLFVDHGSGLKLHSRKRKACLLHRC